MYGFAIFLPLIASIIAGILSFMKHGKDESQASSYDRLAQWITAAAMVASMLIAIMMFFKLALHGGSETITVLAWIDSGWLQVNWALKFDTLSVVMINVVTIVSAMVHIYSIGYMSEDKCIARFQSYLSLFTFGMLMLVTADNLVQLFFGWEAVGLCSYLLIGFWYHKPSANDAAMKAFIVNRVGDFGFSLGIFGVFLLFQTVNLDEIFGLAPQFSDARLQFLGINFHAMSLICFLLFIGAMGKSAQFGLHTWLPDAMEGPTPVSALIHAATMVTAGVFMVARLSPLFDLAPMILAFVTIIGVLTAFFAATVACVQNDIKRVIAYSTCSQLGYMFFALGSSAYQAGIFHLTTHAFFKALLFLGAGSVIHAMHHEQDMRNMGGLWKKIPITFTLMLVGTLTIIGTPLLSGYYSKDMILEAAWASNGAFTNMAYIVGVFVAMLTAFYSWRLMFLTFFGKPRGDAHTHDHAHESPLTMLAPMMVLLVGAIFSGKFLYELFVGYDLGKFWGPAIASGHAKEVIHNAHEVSYFIKKLPLVMVIIGSLVAIFMYLKPLINPKTLAEKMPALYQFLLNKWYIDELYEKIFIQPALKVGQLLWKRGDEGTIDRYGPDGIAKTTLQSSGKINKLQTGLINQYVLIMLIGVVLLLSMILIMGGQ